MIRKQATASQANLITSIHNEVDCINTTRDDGKKVWLSKGGVRSLVLKAENRDGALLVWLEEAPGEAVEVPPSTVLPGGRGVWEQIEIEGFASI